MTVCPICRGELYADRRSVADMLLRGYHGGRVTCQAGCTSIWLFERIVVAGDLELDRLATPKGYHKEPRWILCACGQWDRTMGNNTKRCGACRAKHDRHKHSAAQRRYLARQPAVA
jgi:hypothetical protein